MVPTLVTFLLTIALLLASIFALPNISIGKLKLSTYWMVAFLGAIVVLLFGGISFPSLWEELTKDSSVNPLKILLLFFSMTFLSVYLDETGFFALLANKTLKYAGTSQWKLFLLIFGLVSVLTIFTSNDIVILTFTPFLCLFCKKAKLNPLPYLVMEFAAANTWSMMLLIGNPTNIFLSASANMDFLFYFQTMVFPTLAAGIVELLVLCLLFHKSLSAPIENAQSEEVQIKKAPMVFGLIHLGVCLVLLVISGYLNWPMYLESFFSALSLIVVTLLYCLFFKKSPKDTFACFARLPYELIPFVLSMFVLVLALKEQGIPSSLGQFLGEDHIAWKYGFLSYLSCNIMNNIPMSLFFSTVPSFADPAMQNQAIFATIIGSNLGAFLTPLGALAGIMFTNLLKKYDVAYPFPKFVLYGAIVSLPTLATALLVLTLI